MSETDEIRSETAEAFGVGADDVQYITEDLMASYRDVDESDPTDVSDEIDEEEDSGDDGAPHHKKKRVIVYGNYLVRKGNWLYFKQGDDTNPWSICGTKYERKVPVVKGWRWESIKRCSDDHWGCKITYWV